MNWGGRGRVHRRTENTQASTGQHLTLKPHDSKREIHIHTVREEWVLAVGPPGQNVRSGSHGPSRRVGRRVTVQLPCSA